MKTRFLVSSVVVSMVIWLCTEVQGAPPSGPLPSSRLAWVYDLHTDQDGTPHSDVSLRVDGKTVRLASHFTAQFSTVKRQDYRSHAVPTAALTACSGWWAGQGEEMYVVRRGATLKVYARDLDEGTPCPAYRLLKSVPLRKN